MFKNNTKSIIKSKQADRKIIIKSIVSFFISLILCTLIVIAIIINRYSVERLKMEQLIIEKSIKLDDVISKLLYKTQAISDLVIKSNGKIEDFERTAALFVDDPVILNVLIAPNGIVSAVYPYQGNEAVIGLDFFKEGVGNKEAVMAKETGVLVFGGPFDLVQGGQALVGRLPVFMESTNGQKKFWGIVSVTLKYPDVLNAVGLTAIEISGLSYVIWRINPDNNEKQIIAQGNNYNHRHTHYVEKHIEILNANWFFRVAPILSWYQNSETWILSIIGLGVSFLIAYITKNNMELKATKSQLENKVIETSVLAGESEQLNEVKNINHEIKTPRSEIIAFAESTTYDSDEVAEDNATISVLEKPIFKGNILVCEDNETNQIITKEHLIKTGLNVTIANNGKIGVELAQAQMIKGQPFDLIFMDIHMPIMNGLQATRKLIEIGNKTPIIALTANVMSCDLKNYQKNGINDYLSKPFRVQKLHECLLRYLKPVGYIKEQSYEAIAENTSQKQITTKASAIDKKVVLEQYDGDEEAYENILHIFVKNNKDTLTKIKDAFKSNNLKTAYLISHSLKGAASAIGATKLAAAAFNVEKKISPKDKDLSYFNNPKDMSIEIALLEKEYNAVYDELNVIIKEENILHQTDNISREKALELINRISPFLETGDSKILEYQDEIKDIFLPLLEKYNLLITQMEQYDFELANETIKSIQKFMKD